MLREEMVCPRALMETHISSLEEETDTSSLEEETDTSSLKIPQV